MRARVKELHYQYCAPKSQFNFELWDSEKLSCPAADTAEAAAERESINVYCHLVV